MISCSEAMLTSSTMLKAIKGYSLSRVLEDAHHRSILHIPARFCRALGEPLS